MRLELRGGLLGRLDSLRILDDAQLGEPRTKLGDVAASGALFGELAEGRDGDRVADETPIGDRSSIRIEREPTLVAVLRIAADVDADPGRLGGDHPDELLARVQVLGRHGPGRGEFGLEAHREPQ